MLELLRRSVSGWIAKVLLGLLVVSFAVWGIADVFRGRVVNSVLVAGDTAMTLGDYRMAYQQTEANVARQLGRRPTSEEAKMFGLDQAVLRQLVASALLQEQANRFDLGLSQDRLARIIAEDPSFQDSSGKFSRTAFTQILDNARLSQSDFVRNREEAAKRSQIVEAVSDGVKLPDAFQTALGLYNGERRTVDYVELPASLVQPIANPSDKDLQTYFDAHKSDYRAPEYRGIAYAVLTPQAVADPKAITDQQIADDYEHNGQRYTIPERRRIQQIVYADKAAAEAAEKKLAAGASFEDLVKDSGRSMADVDLGVLAKNEIPEPAIADAAFKLQPNQPSGIVAGSFGPVILRVTEIKPQEKKPLDSVKDEIRQKLALDAAGDIVSKAYNTYEDARAGGATLAEAAAKAGLKVETVKAVDTQGKDPSGQPVTGLPDQDQLLQQAFQTDQGVDNPPLNYQSSGYVFYDVTNIEPAHDQDLAAVKEKVVADWKAAETKRLLEKRAADAKAGLEKGETLDAIASQAGLKKQTASAITRESGVSEIGAAATTAAFSGPKGLVATAVSKSGDSQLLMKVVEVARPADPDQNVPAPQREQLAQMLQNDFLQAYITALQGKYPVSVHPTAIERAKAEVR